MHQEGCFIWGNKGLQRVRGVRTPLHLLHAPAPAPAAMGSMQPFSAMASLGLGACSRGGGRRREIAALRVLLFLNRVSQTPEPRATGVKSN